MSLNKSEAELIKMEKELGRNNSELEKFKNLNTQATESVNKFDGEIKKLEGDLSSIYSKYKNNANSVEALKEKQDVLNQILQKQDGKVKTLQDTLHASKSAFGENPGMTWVIWGTGKHPVGVDTGVSQYNNVEKQGRNAAHRHQFRIGMHFWYSSADDAGAYYNSESKYNSRARSLV